MIEIGVQARRYIKEFAQILLGRQDQGSLRAHLAKSTAGTFALKVTSTGLGFLTALLLARLLGAAGYGTYAYALAWVALLSIPAMLGLDRLLVREIAVYRTRSEWDLMRGLLRQANSAALLVSLSLVLLAAVVTWVLREHLNPEMLPAFWVGLIMLPLMTLTRLRQAVMQGLQHVVAGQLPEMLIRPLLFVALVGGAYLFLKENLNALWAVGMNVAATGAAFFIGTWMLFNVLPQAVKEAVPDYQTRAWVRSALPLLLVTGLGVINSQIDITMLGAILGAEPTGIYAVANRIAGFIIFILGSVNAVLAPTIARLYVSGQMRRLQRIVTKSARVILFLSIPVALSLIVFGRWVLLLFGQDFTQGGTALAILSTGQLINAAAGSVGLLLIMTGHERDVAIAIGLSVALNVILNAILIPRWGIAGAAVTTASSMILRNLWLLVQVYRRFGIDSTALGRISHWREA